MYYSQSVLFFNLFLKTPAIGYLIIVYLVRNKRLFAHSIRDVSPEIVSFTVLIGY